MKKSIYFITIILVLQLILFSCKIVNNQTVNNNVSQTRYFSSDSNWSDSLANSGPLVKSALLNLFGDDINILNKSLSTSLTKNEYDKLKVLSIETYRIDTVSIKGIKENASIKEMLKLVKTEAQCYILKDSDIILFMEQYMEKGQWKVTEIGRIFEDVGNQIETLYFKENIKIHNVIINDDRYGKKKFIVFVRNGQYISIEHGKEVPFLQELLEFKKNIESGLIF